jgi:hypothetical protein
MNLGTKVLELISTLESDNKEVLEMIRLRIENDSTLEESLKADYLEDPLSLDISFFDSEVDTYHAYDVGRYEAFNEIIRELKRITHD